MARMGWLGVSGSREVTREQARFIEEKLYDAREEYRNVLHGACEGVDTICAVAAHFFHKPPTAVVPWQRSRVDEVALFYSHDWIYMPRETDYRARNQKLVDLSDRFMAFPRFPEKHAQSIRSGTWQTIRMAQRKGIDVIVYVLEEI